MTLIRNLDSEARSRSPNSSKKNEEITLGPTDQELRARALRDRAALIEAGLA